MTEETKQRFDEEVKTIEASGVVRLRYVLRKTVVELDEIIVSKAHRRKGHGTAALKMFMTLAKRYGLDVALTPEPIPNEAPSLSKTALKTWYRKHGFIANKTARYSNWETTRVLIHPKDKPIK